MRLYVIGAGAALGLTACSGFSGGSGPAQMDLVEASNGFGRLLPHEALALDGEGKVTQDRRALRTIDDLLLVVSPSNPVLPVPHWPAAAVLPSGSAGNQYLYLEFSEPIDIDSVLTPDPLDQGPAGLTSAVEVLAINPEDSSSVPLVGRVLVGGRTRGGAPQGDPPALGLQTWVALEGDPARPVALEVDGAFPGLGFPGTQDAAFQGGASLLSERSLVFVIDTDGDLSTHETFPTGRQIVMRAGAQVRSKAGKPLVNTVLACSTVGPDELPPEVLLSPLPEGLPQFTPAYGAVDVDPSTAITLRFTEPVQPLSVGPLPQGQPPALSTAVRVHFGPAVMQTDVPFSALPVSIFDLSTWVLTPSFAFPGSGPVFAQCGTFSAVAIDVAPAQIRDLAQAPNLGGAPNLNTLPAASNFTTGEGPGLVNAPVAPDVILAGRGGGTPSVSVIDLNGFGQSTGNPTFDFTYTSFPQGNSNYPNNPNLKLQGAAISPALSPGTCTVDGGSAGVFTLTLDSSLDSRLVRDPVIQSVEDMMLGQPLDLVFNDAKDTNGCKSGGGNVCAISGLRLFDGGNNIQLAPHPNPPRMSFPPLCVQPFIGVEEATSTASAGQNLLLPGNPLGDPLNGIPPSGLLSMGGNTGFFGPDLPGTPLGGCVGYAVRQQIGQFLYLADRVRREIVVLNSNRMTVLDRISVPDPTDLAMSPNLDFLAVTNQVANSVTFIDIDPNSSSFHKIVKTLTVDDGPRGIAWDPGNEGLIVCCEKAGTAQVISAFDLSVRKTLKNALTQPFDVVITQRQVGFGTGRNVWFAWILNRNGELALFESGPNGVNGWGYDDVIGIAQPRFNQPQAIAVDIRNQSSAVWVAHQDPLGPDGLPTGQKGGAVSNMAVQSTVAGVIVIGPAAGPAGFRQMSLALQGSFGEEVLTGAPTDIATDDMSNLGLQPNMQPYQGAGNPKNTNGKSLVRGQILNNIATGIILTAKAPEYLFLAIPNSTEGPGVVDVIELGSSLTRYDTNAYLPGKQSIQVPFVQVLCDYWRQ